MIQKAEKAFRTISEAADDLDVPQHVLRFWETKFTQVKPLKRGGNRRYYRPEDLNLLHAIKHQLYDEGHSIKDVQGLMREEGLKAFVEGWLDTVAPAPAPEPVAKEAAPAPPVEEVTEAPEEEPVEAKETSPAEDDDTIRVSKDLVRALVNDLRALRQIIDRLPD